MARWSKPASFIIVAVAFGVLVGGSNLPTPLFPLYQRHYRFSATVLTLLFCTYVAFLIPSLLTLGRLSDRVGRKPVLVSGIALSALSSVAFASARGLIWLFAGEAIYGIASGLVNSGAAAALRELHPGDSAGGGALAATLAQSAGLASGPLISGTLAAVTPWPTVSPYVLHIALVIMLVALLAAIPETRPKRPAPKERVPLLHLSAGPDGLLAVQLGAVFVAWMSGGWMLSLSPSYLVSGIHIDIPSVSGSLCAAFFILSFCSQLMFGRKVKRRPLEAAFVALVGGAGLLAAALPLHSFAVAFVGTLLFGVGFGGVNVTALSTVLSLAPPEARGGVTSTFLVVGYTGFSVPILLDGMIASSVGVPAATLMFLGALAIGAACVGLAAQGAPHPDGPHPARASRRTPQLIDAD